jgi:hypothetical protein
MGLSIILYIVYFGFAIKLQQPFSFPKLSSNWTTSRIFNERVFSNNYGIITL